MTKRNFSAWVGLGIAALLISGVVRAATSRFEQRSNAILNQIRAERERLHLSAEELRARYPTPEVTLCSFTRVVPGGTGEVVTRGNFEAGTKFLFDNDKIEVVKESLVVGAGQRESEYRATIKVAQNLGPDSANVYSYQPVTGRGTYCQAVYIGGKYEWEFTADNGWRIRLTPLREPTGGEGEVTVVYRAEFYRGRETKPFEATEVSVSGTPGGYGGNIKESSAGELESLSQKMIDPNLSERERAQLQKRLEEVIAKMSEPNYAEEMEKKKQEFGCHVINFSLMGNTVQGNMLCGEKVGIPDSSGRLELKGTMRFVGP